MASILAYDAAGRVIASLDFVRAPADDGSVSVVDPVAYEAAGRKFSDLWFVPGAVGSGAWPEHLGVAATRFVVELDGSRIVALVSADGSSRRDRAQIEAAVAAALASGADVREIVGSVAKPLVL